MAVRRDTLQHAFQTGPVESGVRPLWFGRDLSSAAKLTPKCFEALAPVPKFQQALEVLKSATTRLAQHVQKHACPRKGHSARQLGASAIRVQGLSLF